MALIDILPQYRYKPLDLTPVGTQLVPREPEVTQVERPIVALPQEAIASTRSIPVPTVSPPGVGNQTLAQNLPKTRLVLPDVYKGLAPLAEAVSDSTVVNPHARAAIIAQMGLESGWKTPKDFSYGNIIKGSTWKGPVKDRPDKDAKGNPITQTFRQYSSANEFLDNYLSLLKTTYPKAYEELHSADFDIDRFTSGLVDQKFKYAESPNYKSDVKRIYNSVDSRINRNQQ
jgi:hypothetical protein